MFKDSINVKLGQDHKLLAFLGGDYLPNNSNTQHVRKRRTQSWNRDVISDGQRRVWPAPFTSVYKFAHHSNRHKFTCGVNDDSQITGLTTGVFDQRRFDGPGVASVLRNGNFQQEGLDYFLSHGVFSFETRPNQRWKELNLSTITAFSENAGQLYYTDAVGKDHTAGTNRYFGIIRNITSANYEEWKVTCTDATTLTISGSASGVIGTATFGVNGGLFVSSVLSFEFIPYTGQAQVAIGIGDEFLLTPFNKITVSPTAIEETWSLIKVNPINLTAKPSFQPANTARTDKPILEIHTRSLDYNTEEATWYIQFTSASEYKIGRTRISDGLTLWENNTIADGYSYKNEDIHFTIIPSAIAFEAGDSFDFSTGARVENYLVYGSVSGWAPNAKIGEWYWNGKIGFKIPKLEYTATVKNSTIITSAHALAGSWNTVVSNNQILRSVSFDNGIFLTSGDNSIIAGSTNGRNWTSDLSTIYTPIPNKYLVDIGPNGNIATSVDGVLWDKRPSHTTENLKSSTYLTNFLTTEKSETIFFDWQTTNQIDNVKTLFNQGNAIVLSGVSLWVKSGSTFAKSTHPLFLSADGNTVYVTDPSIPLTGQQGTDPNTPFTNGTELYISYDQALINCVIVVGSNGTILTSATGIGWAHQQSGSIQNLNGITWSNNAIIAVGDNGTILKSVDRLNWLPVSSGVTADLKSVIYDPIANVFIAVGTNGTIIRSNANGDIWNNLNYFTTGTFSAIAYGDGKFVAVGPDGWIASSTNGTVWTRYVGKPLNSIAYAQGVWVGVGGSTNNLALVAHPRPVHSMAEPSFYKVEFNSPDTATVNNNIYGYRKGLKPSGGSTGIITPPPSIIVPGNEVFTISPASVHPGDMVTVTITGGVPNSYFTSGISPTPESSIAGVQKYPNNFGNNGSSLSGYLDDHGNWTSAPFAFTDTTIQPNTVATLVFTCKINFYPFKLSSDLPNTPAGQSHPKFFNVASTLAAQPATVFGPTGNESILITPGSPNTGDDLFLNISGGPVIPSGVTSVTTQSTFLNNSLNGTSVKWMFADLNIANINPGAVLNASGVLTSTQRLGVPQANASLTQPWPVGFNDQTISINIAFTFNPPPSFLAIHPTAVPFTITKIVNIVNTNYVAPGTTPLVFGPTGNEVITLTSASTATGDNVFFSVIGGPTAAQYGNSPSAIYVSGKFTNPNSGGAAISFALPGVTYPQTLQAMTLAADGSLALNDLGTIQWFAGPGLKWPPGFNDAILSCDFTFSFYPPESWPGQTGTIPYKIFKHIDIPNSDYVAPPIVPAAKTSSPQTLTITPNNTTVGSQVTISITGGIPNTRFQLAWSNRPESMLNGVLQVPNLPASLDGGLGGFLNASGNWTSPPFVCVDSVIQPSNIPVMAFDLVAVFNGLTQAQMDAGVLGSFATQWETIITTQPVAPLMFGAPMLFGALSDPILPTEFWWEDEFCKFKVDKQILPNGNIIEYQFGDTVEVYIAPKGSFYADQIVSETNPEPLLYNEEYFPLFHSHGSVIFPNAVPGDNIIIDKAFKDVIRLKIDGSSGLYPELSAVDDWIPLEFRYKDTYTSEEQFSDLTIRIDAYLAGNPDKIVFTVYQPRYGTSDINSSAVIAFDPYFFADYIKYNTRYSLMFMQEESYGQKLRVKISENLRTYARVRLNFEEIAYINIIDGPISGTNIETDIKLFDTFNVHFIEGGALPINFNAEGYDIFPFDTVAYESKVSSGVLAGFVEIAPGFLDYTGNPSDWIMPKRTTTPSIFTAEEKPETAGARFTEGFTVIERTVSNPLVIDRLSAFYDVNAANGLVIQALATEYLITHNGPGSTPTLIVESLDNLGTFGNPTPNLFIFPQIPGALSLNGFTFTLPPGFTAPFRLRIV